MQRRNRTSAPGRLLRDLDVKDIEDILSTLERGSPLGNQTITENNIIPPRTEAVPIQRPQILRNSVSAPGSVQMSPSNTPPLDTNILQQQTTQTAIDNRFVFVQYDPDIRSSTAPRGEKALMQRGDTFAKKKTVFDQLKNRFDLR
jgi:hypothetical protein